MGDEGCEEMEIETERLEVDDEILSEGG